MTLRNVKLPSGEIKLTPSEERYERMSVVDGLTTEQIAAAAGRKINTIYMALLSARQKRLDIERLKAMDE